MSGPSRGALIFGAGLVVPGVPLPAKQDPSLPRNVKAVRVGEADLLLTRGERKRVMRRLLVMKAQRGDIET
jgi:hypothetical protein